MYENIKTATDINDSPILQEDWDAVIYLLSIFVDQYNQMPDGLLGKGLTNKPFLHSHEYLNFLGYADDPVWKKNSDQLQWSEKIISIRQSAKAYLNNNRK